MRTNDINTVNLGGLYRGPDGQLYEAVGIIDRPAVILHRVTDGVERVVVASAPIAEGYSSVSADAAQAELLSVLRQSRERR